MAKCSLKLIRKVLSPRDKKKVQSRLQKAYTNNGEGFYVNAPKPSKINLKKLLEYINRYMKRGPIALDRIIMYDGEQVMFQYKDKRTNRMETMTMEVETFIASLIHHIRDKYFNTIRMYGIYSRRIKTVMKQLIKQYQKKVRRMLVSLKEALKPKTWRERIVAEFSDDPLECSVCGEHYEYQGMSVRKNGSLRVIYANNSEAKRYMREENKKIGQEEYQNEYEKETQKAHERVRFDWEKQRQLYMSQLQ